MLDAPSNRFSLIAVDSLAVRYFLMTGLTKCFQITQVVEARPGVAATDQRYDVIDFQLFRTRANGTYLVAFFRHLASIRPPVIDFPLSAASL